jgi:hypothetical protein
MAKTLLHSSKYQVLKESNLINYAGNIGLERLLLITNVTANKVIYQFNDPTKGGNVTFLNQNNESSLELFYDIANDSDINPGDVYQFFYDSSEVHFSPDESLLDPVSKLRVSNPENLVDTDFEYGLQSTKWETIQTVNNIPTVFSSSGDAPLEGVLSVEALLGSKQVKVTCNTPHNLSIGDPVSCQGVVDYQAEGFFVVSGVSSPLVFFFEIDVVATTTGDISGSYTSIVPAKFFEGAPLNVNISHGANTDQQSPSNITVETEATHGFTTGTKVYLRNTIGPKKLVVVDPTGIAPDGRPYVDTDAFFVLSSTINTLSDTGRPSYQEKPVISYDWECTHNLYLEEPNLDIPTSTITWVDHQMQSKFCLLFNTPRKGDQNMGLVDGQVVFVNVIDQDTFTIYSDEALTQQITLSAYDTNLGRCRFGLVYLITQTTGSSKYTRYYTESFFTATTGYLQGPLRYYGGYYSYLRIDDQLGFVPDYVDVFNIQVYGQGIYYYWYYLYIRFDNGNAYNALYARWSSNYQWVNAGVPTQRLQQNQLYQSGGAYYVRYYHYLASGYGYHIWRMQVTGYASINPGNQFSGSDLADTEYGLGGQEPDFISGFQGKTADSPYRTSADGFTNNNPQYINGRYGSVNRYDSETVTSLPPKDGSFNTNTRFGHSFNDPTNSENFYILGKYLTSDRNTIFYANHGIPNQQEATINVINYSQGDEEFRFNNNGSDTLAFPATFDVKVNVVSDDVFRIQDLTGLTNTDDIVYFPSEFELTYRQDNELYNSIYINNHKITTTSEATLEVEGQNEATPEIYTVAQDASGFIIEGTRLGKGEIDPSLILYRGKTYDFVLDVGVTEAFYLTTSDDTAWVSGSYVGEYTTGVTGSRATGSQTLSITVDATAPDNIYYAAGTNADLFGAIEVRDVGVEIGGVSNNTVYNINRINDSRLTLQQTSNTTASGTTSAIGASNSNPGSATINAWSPLGLTPTNVTITGIEYRGDFSARNEYVVITFADGDSYFIGQTNGLDTSTFRKEEFFGTKNITDLVDPSGNFVVSYAPTSRVNFAVPGMSNYWEIRFIVSGGTGVVTLSSGGSGEHTLNVASLKGAYDGVFEMVETPTPNTFKVQTDFEIPAREYEFTTADVDTGDNTITFVDPHNFVTGERIEYDNGGNLDMIAYDTSTGDTTLYIVVVDEFSVKISTSELGAKEGNHTTLFSAPGTHKIISDSVLKLVKGAGTIDIQVGSKEVIGSGTSFLNQFKRFDKIFITQNDFTKQYLIDKVTENEKLILFDDVTGSGTGTSYFFITELVLRPDGYGIHLPFDGGVNITAGTSPDSKIVRQSRKYFRYQSGKGIQNSFAINFNPPKIVRDLIKATGTTAKINTQEAHNLSVGDIIVIEGAEVSVGNNTFNGDFSVSAVNTPFQFEYEMNEAPQQSKAAGFPTYHRKNWNDSYIRAGMFDDQNGFFYEYDGQNIYCVRRSSTKQLAGSVNVERQSQVVTGNDTSFTTQLKVNEYVVIRGQSYKVVEIGSDSRMTIQPSYKGVDAERVKMTVTVDTRVEQERWNIDKCDGTGLHGYYLDINRIQMAYADYSWYGAGKIRFGFKDQNGHVKYVHEFKHNNILNESYFRSGNLPGRYEIMNGPQATTAPTLFHFGTSIIMDGRFDNDKAYLFTANSKPFAFTNGSSFTFNSTDQSTFEQITLNGNRVWVYAFQCNQTDAERVSTGLLVAEGSNLEAGTYVSQVQIAGAQSKIFTSYPATSTLPPTSIFPTIPSATTFTFGESETVDLTRPIPLISVRLAASVDSSLTGVVGEREIINRMQLSLKQAGVTANQDIEVFLILNAQPSNMNFDKVSSPSLSELIEHDSGDTLTSGTVVYAVKASAGSQEIDLSELLELGNSILGGDSIFPAGPDLLTVAVQPQNTSGIASSTPFKVSGKVSWSESQA